MEEEEPPESTTLAHTSSEAEVWAEKSSHDPSIEPASPTESEKGSPEKESLLGKPPSGDTTETILSKDLEDYVDQSESQEAEVKVQEKKYTIGDGFEEPVVNSRSRSHERRSQSEEKDEFPDYSTHSSNVEDLRSRVFVGHLNTKECEKKDVVEVFHPYGTILGVNLQRGYGFVQFEKEESALEAIKELKGTLFFGQNLGSYVITRNVMITGAIEYSPCVK